jgi:hypothetical protein
MDWKYVKALKSKDSIKKFETTYGFTFPDSFKGVVTKFNGGRPEKDIYDTNVTKERTIKSLLSFNVDDRETVWKVAEWNKQELGNRYVAFAIDNFGNLICFTVSDNSIIYMDMETLKVETIASDFSSFMDNLYTID